MIDLSRIHHLMVDTVHTQLFSVFCCDVMAPKVPIDVLNESTTDKCREKLCPTTDTNDGNTQINCTRHHVPLCCVPFTWIWACSSMCGHLLVIQGWADVCPTMQQ